MPCTPASCCSAAATQAFNRRLKAFTHPGPSLILPFNKRRPCAGRNGRFCCSVPTPRPLPTPLGLLLAPGSCASILSPCSSGQELSRCNWEVLRVSAGRVSGCSAPGIRAAPVFHVTPPLFVSLCRCPQLPFHTSDMGCAGEPRVSSFLPLGLPAAAGSWQPG